MNRPRINRTLTTLSGVEPMFVLTLAAVCIPALLPTMSRLDTLFLVALSGWWTPFAVVAWIVGRVRGFRWLQLCAVSAVATAMLMHGFFFLTDFGRAIVVGIPPFPGAVLIFSSSVSGVGAAVASWAALLEFQLLDACDRDARAEKGICTTCGFPRVASSSLCPECGTNYEGGDTK